MTRVRVTAPRSVTPNSVTPNSTPIGTALNGGRSAAASLDAEEETDAGQLFVRSLIRSQLRLGLVVALGFLLIMLAFPLMLGLVPGLADSTIAGLPFDWVLLGAGIYPVIGLSAWLYVRTAARNEARYRDLAGDK
ncbi:membrane protein [Arthrobacter sp. 9MFCol3.1]|uniref:membrane protein n=1 Tax=Arthrobacter sp. 9MFCol3.1 TaxID=1150398 RepID=UPI00047BAD44|nr:membrane protein [Arthrobacter sp. 9MFCol3.1]